MRTLVPAAFLSRRALLAALAPAVLSGSSRASAPRVRVRGPVPTIRLGVLRQAELQDRCATAALGIELGLAESAQTAALVGGGLERSIAEVRSAADAIEQVRSLAAAGAQAVITALEADAARTALEALAGTAMVHLPLGATAIRWTAQRAGRRVFDVVLDGAARARALAEALAATGLRRVHVFAAAGLPRAAAALAGALRACGVEPAASGACRDASELGKAARAARGLAADALVLAWPGHLPPEVAREIQDWRGGPLLALAFAPEEPPALATSVVWAAEWHEGLERYGAAQLNERFRRRFGRGMDGPAWAGWTAVKAVVEAGLRSAAGDPAALAAALGSLTFDGHKGAPLAFDPNGRLVQPAYVVGRLPCDGSGPPRVVHSSEEPVR